MEDIDKSDNDPEPSNRFDIKGSSNVTLYHLTRRCEVPSRNQGLFHRGNS